jgi:hypothetical protein
LFTAKGSYIRYRLGWTVHSCNLTNNYNGSIAVIDNSKLNTIKVKVKLMHKLKPQKFQFIFVLKISDKVLITPFKNKIIPPPMCLYDISFPQQINHLAWSYSNMDFMVILSNAQLVLYKYQKQTNGKG